MQKITGLIILTSLLAYSALDAAPLKPLSVPGGLQSRSLNPDSSNSGGAKFKNQGFKIDSRVKSQLKRSFSTSRTPPTSGLDQAYNSLKASITKLRQTQYTYNTGIDRCLGKTYSDKEKRDAMCQTASSTACAQNLVNRCMTQISNSYSAAQNGVTNSAKKVEQEALRFVSQRNVSARRMSSGGQATQSGAVSAGQETARPTEQRSRKPWSKFKNKIKNTFKAK